MRNPLFRRRAAPSPDGDGLGALCKHLQEILTVHGGDHKSAYESAHGGLKRLVEGLGRLPAAERAGPPPDHGVRERGHEVGGRQRRRPRPLAGHGVPAIRPAEAPPDIGAFRGKQAGLRLRHQRRVGEIFHGSEDIANRENQKNIDDTAQPFEEHETPKNPANLTRDYAAERDFQSLRDFKNKRINWPPRTR